MSFERVKHIDLYKLLDVDSNASEASIRSSYRKLAKTCHPDKNSNSDSVFKFHQLTDALNVLTLSNQRQEYDKLQKKKEEKERLNSKLDEKTRKFKKDLEKRERNQRSDEANSHDTDNEERLILKLRAEAAVLLDEEQVAIVDKLLTKISLGKEKENENINPIIKVKWDKNCNLYSNETLSRIFNKYGELENIVSKKHSALVEFKCLESACIALKSEQGFEKNPISVKPLFSSNLIPKSIFVKYSCVTDSWPNRIDKALLEIETYVFGRLLNNLY